MVQNQEHWKTGHRPAKEIGTKDVKFNISELFRHSDNIQEDTSHIPVSFLNAFDNTGHAPWGAHIPYQELVLDSQ